MSVGIGRALRIVRDQEQFGLGDQPRAAISSPYNTGQLAQIVWSDLFDSVKFPVSRAEAMAVPAMARCRHIICGSIARAPIRVYRGADPLPVQPSWTYRTEATGQLPPFHRTLWTVDDLMFYGWSLWAVGRDSEGVMNDAARVDADDWTFEDGQVKVANAEGVMVGVEDREVVLIPGPHEGLLSFGRQAIRHASHLNFGADVAVETPIPNIELHDEGEIQLTDAEQDALVAKWAAARRGENGGVAYTSRGLKVIAHGQRDGQLLIEGRNAAAVDLARAASLPASAIDATNAGASLTYETTEGRNKELIDFGLALYMAAISARLSMDDVVPRGQRAAFDLEELLGPAPLSAGPTTED